MEYPEHVFVRHLILCPILPRMNIEEDYLSERKSTLLNFNKGELCRNPFPSTQPFSVSLYYEPSLDLPSFHESPILT